MGPPETDEEVHGHCSNHEWDCSARRRDLAPARARLSGREPGRAGRAHHHARPGRAGRRPRLLASRCGSLPPADRPASRCSGCPPRPACAIELGRSTPMAAPIPAPSSLGAALFAPDHRFAIPRRGAGPRRRQRGCRRRAVRRRHRGAAAARRAPTAGRARQPRRRLSGDADLADGAFPEPAAVVLAIAAAQAAPWNGRHLALGIEPICSPFGLGPATARADNPLARSGVPTALDFSARPAFHHALPHRSGGAVSRCRASLVKPNRPVFTDLAGLAAMVADGDRFGVGGHHFARLPIALLRAIAERGARPVCATSRGPAACRSSSCSRRAPSPRSTSASPASTFSACRRASAPPRRPASVPVRDWTALAMIQALRAAQQNLPSLPFQLPAGSDMMARIPGAKEAADPLDGGAVGVVPALGSTRWCCMRSAPTRAAMCRSSVRARSTSPWSARRARCWSRSRRSYRSVRSPLPAARP